MDCKGKSHSQIIRVAAITERREEQYIPQGPTVISARLTGGAKKAVVNTIAVMKCTFLLASNLGLYGRPWVGPSQHATIYSSPTKHGRAEKSSVMYSCYFADQMQPISPCWKYRCAPYFANIIARRRPNLKNKHKTGIYPIMEMEYEQNRINYD